MSIIRDDEVLPRIRRQPGDYIGQEVTLPPVATYVTAIVDSRSLWTQRAAREIVLSLTIEAFVDTSWVVIGGFTTDASEKRNRDGVLLDASSVRVRLPRTRQGQPPVRTVLQCASACTGAVRLVFDDTPLPARAPQEHQSVTYDNDNEAVGTAVASVTVGAFAVGNNANRFMAVGVASYSGTAGDSVVTSVSHNGVTTGWASIVTHLDPDLDRASLWGKVAPAVVTATVVVTMVGTNDALGVNALSVWDVDQTTPTAGAVGSDGTVDPITVTVSAATGDLVYDVVNAYGTPAASYAVGVGASQTSRANAVVFNYATYGERLLASTEPGAASVTMSWAATAATTSFWTQAACAIKAAAGAAQQPAQWMPSIQKPQRRRRVVAF